MLRPVHIEWRIPTALAQPLLGAGVLVALAGALWWWMSAPVQESPVARVVTAPRSHGTPVDNATTVMVDVIGAVRHPGVVRLPTGARVVDAVAAAGGLLPHRAPVVNMARVVVDGEQLIIGAAGGGASRLSEAGSAGTMGRVDLNTASATQLDGLPGIGPVLAERIVAFRREHGRFEHARDLLDVPGIGDAKYAELADSVSAS